jgi:site-specific DNA-methyltransferase (adenine-specific)
MSDAAQAAGLDSNHEYDEADEQNWAEAPPRDAIDDYRREIDPFYSSMMNEGMFSTGTVTWGTPREVFEGLDREFHFDLDPCPGEATLKAGIRHLSDGLKENWFPFTAAFVNPPYGRDIVKWIERAKMFATIGFPREKSVVLLIPARTDTAWWHDSIMPHAKEIRFIRGRLGFTGVQPKPEKDRKTIRSRAPFPSVVVVL